jgi:hypothetical protein
MPYDPTRLPVGERIVLDVVAVLDAIAPPAYASKVKGKVRRWDGNPFDATKFPAVAVVEGVEERDDANSGRISYLLPLSLMLVVHGQDWNTQLKKLAADIQVALTNDHTRGGLAFDTKVGTLEIFDSEPGKPIGVAQMDARIRYRTQYHDPGTPS